ncbi:hypothetical protein CHS0354_004346 [Potamilus streckersoni]|uniref:Uncharacterized protein n=1 Tax=Potamilus streckersoni TaxID=2493646 RepID=A0AAE0VUM1_9BIVA|nr:hypothetical protein CHS0354_004346 [Potamilus streckersoni]
MMIRVIREYGSLFLSNVVSIRENVGTLRLCIDWRQLNASTKRDAYMLPKFDTVDSLTIPSGMFKLFSEFIGKGTMQASGSSKILYFFISHHGERFSRAYQTNPVKNAWYTRSRSEIGLEIVYRTNLQAYNATKSDVTGYSPILFLMLGCHPIAICRRLFGYPS